MKQIELTPLMKQFVSIQCTHKDAVVLFGIGDEYVTWQDTARLVSEILGLTLRVSEEVNWTDGTPFMECSFPINTTNAMVDKLSKSVSKVVLCDQLEKSERQETPFQKALKELWEKTDSVKKC